MFQYFKHLKSSKKCPCIFTCRKYSPIVQAPTRYKLAVVFISCLTWTLFILSLCCMLAWATLIALWDFWFYTIPYNVFSTDPNGLVIVENARPTYAYEAAVRICICIVRFQKEVNIYNESWLNVLSTRYLEIGTSECRNVGRNNYWQN